MKKYCKINYNAPGLICSVGQTLNPNNSNSLSLIFLPLFLLYRKLATILCKTSAKLQSSLPFLVLVVTNMEQNASPWGGVETQVSSSSLFTTEEKLLALTSKCGQRLYAYIRNNQEFGPSVPHWKKSKQFKVFLEK